MLSLNAELCFWMLALPLLATLALGSEFTATSPLRPAKFVHHRPRFSARQTTTPMPTLVKVDENDPAIHYYLNPSHSENSQTMTIPPLSMCQVIPNTTIPLDSNCVPLEKIQPNQSVKDIQSEKMLTTTTARPMTAHYQHVYKILSKNVLKYQVPQKMSRARLLNYIYNYAANKNISTSATYSTSTFEISGVAKESTNLNDFPDRKYTSTMTFYHKTSEKSDHIGHVQSVSEVLLSILKDAQKNAIKNIPQTDVSSNQTLLRFHNYILGVQGSEGDSRVRRHVTEQQPRVDKLFGAPEEPKTAVINNRTEMGIHPDDTIDLQTEMPSLASDVEQEIVADTDDLKPETMSPASEVGNTTAADTDELQPPIFNPAPEIDQDITTNILNPVSKFDNATNPDIKPQLSTLAPKYTSKVVENIPLSQNKSVSINETASILPVSSSGQPKSRAQRTRGVKATSQTKATTTKPPKGGKYSIDSLGEIILAVVCVFLVANFVLVVVLFFKKTKK